MFGIFILLINLFLQISMNALLLVKDVVRSVSTVMDPSSVTASRAINWRTTMSPVQV